MTYVDKTSLNRHKLKQCRWNQHSFITPTATATWHRSTPPAPRPAEPQYFVHAFGAAVFGEAVVDKIPVNDHFVHQLFGQAVQPFALGVGPAVAGVDVVYGVCHALFEGNQRLAQGGAADVADDAGGYVFVSLVAHSASE